MEQTAVEWYEKQIWSLQLKLEKKEISIGIYAVKRVELFEQAKEIEKQQELKKWIETWSLGYNSGFDNCKKKYNTKQQEQ